MFFYRISSAFSAWSSSGAIERYHLYIFHEAAYLSTELWAILLRLSPIRICFKLHVISLIGRAQPRAPSGRHSVDHLKAADRALFRLRTSIVMCFFIVCQRLAYDRRHSPIDSTVSDLVI